MNAPLPDVQPTPQAATSAFKRRGGLGRVARAWGYSLAGLRAAVRHEAAFRQELAIGVPLMFAAFWVGVTPAWTLALDGVVLLVWLVELLNSALEALADAVSMQPHPLLGRAKDLGSAAVMLSLLLAVVTWVVGLTQRLGAL